MVKKIFFYKKQQTQTSFKNELKIWKSNKQESKEVTVTKNSSISYLDSYLDENGILGGGGRIKRSNIDDECKHPIILLKRN